MLHVAFDEADITPPLGTSMPGYFRDRQATGVLDPLKAKALVLRQDKVSVALVTLDLIGMSAALVNRIRQAVKEAAKPGPQHIFVHCSHTHTGGMLPRQDTFTSDAETIYPDFYPGKVDEKWVSAVIDKTAGAVAAAAGKLAEEKKTTQCEGSEATVAHYRRYVMKDGSVRTNPGRGNPNIVRPAGQIDPRVHVLRFHSNKIAAVIYGVHPDCVGGTQLSADYPAHLADTLRHALGHDWRVLFLNACCGNINHIDVKNKEQKSGPDESKRIGQTIALAALEAMRKEEMLKADKLAAASKSVSSALRKPRPEDVKEAEELLRTYKETGKNPFGFNELYAPAAVVLAKTKDRTHEAEIAALRLGSFGLAFLPGEIFVELAGEVEELSPLKPTRTIGLTNGSMGYIPTKRGHAEGGYEAGYRSARYVPETGHEWARTAGQLFKGM
jgi:hypothetical protein